MRTETQNLPIGDLSGVLQAQALDAELDLFQDLRKWVFKGDRSRHLFTNYSIPYSLYSKITSVSEQYAKYFSKIPLDKAVASDPT